MLNKFQIPIGLVGKQGFIDEENCPNLNELMFIRSRQYLYKARFTQYPTLVIRNAHINLLYFLMD